MLLIKNTSGDIRPPLSKSLPNTAGLNKENFPDIYGIIMDDCITLYSYIHP